MARRDPHDILGVPRDASQATIKAAWRRLAREHHPDLSSADQAAMRLATRRMAEINAAYEELRSGRAGATAASAAPTRPRAPTGPSTRTKAHAPGGPPRPRPGRPVTGRVNMGEAFRAGAATGGASRRPHLAGHAPPPDWRTGPEPLRASAPTGPLRTRASRRRPPPLPGIEEALATRIEFGRFHGHTLGEIAAFEPSYIDWVASTITRDRALVAAARVVRDDLDVRGVRRIRRAERVAPQPPEEHFGEP